MVVYEVTAVVEAKLADDYEQYMTERHIADVLATGYFSSATIDRIGEKYRIRYYASDQASLDAYLASEAPRLRDDFNSHFPDGIELTRAVWDNIGEFSIDS